MKTRKFFFLLSILCGLSYLANSGNNQEGSNHNTTTISGSVTDKSSNESLAGVKISVEGTSKSAYTDASGNFKIEGLTPGEYKLQVSYISYKDKTISVDMEKVSEKMPVVLEPVEP